MTKVEQHILSKHSKTIAILEDLVLAEISPNAIARKYEVSGAYVYQLKKDNKVLFEEV